MSTLEEANVEQFLHILDEIDGLKKELENKKAEVHKGLRECNKERKLKENITLEAKETQVENNQLKNELEAKKKELQVIQDQYKK